MVNSEIDDIGVTAHQPTLNSDSISCSDKMTFPVTLNNPTEKRSEGKFYLTADNLCQKSYPTYFVLKPNESKGFSVTAHFKAGPKEIRHVPSLFTFQFEFKVPSNSSKKFTFQNIMNTYSGGLEKRVPHPPQNSKMVNVFVFGIAGTGKSAFIQTLYTALHGGGIRVGDVKVGGCDEHCTANLRRHEFKGTALERIAVWDSFGLAGDTYNGGEIRHIARGLLPDGWGIQSRVGVTLAGEDMKLALRTADARRPTAFLVFFPDGAEEGDEDMEHLRTNLGHLKDMGIMPIIVIGMVDVKFPEIRKNAMHPPQGLLDKKKKIGDVLGLPSNHVTYSVPYESESERNFQIEQLMYQTMDLVLRKSSEYISSADYEPVIARGMKKFNFFEDESQNQTTAHTVDLERTHNSSLCSICLINPCEMLIMPCRHACVCQDCSHDIDTCPLDRQKIDRMEQIFIN